ncbi:hypothetical protein [Paenibacillus sp. J2TS4]|uniref:GH39 family glycosyl hydrolase n=1 Tax=Paenibacillus sp. J2TS4 TaxID=2807194 RepID=UPI001B18D0A6|nr:hypothetical protein [Paenibacillus sp. J2TS4]GIP33285.1 hypothetical protein J2TS4_24950 [Paenibacillus sp. J2TS4]
MPEIQLNIDRPLGAVKPIHGVNNGPVTYGSLVDVSDYFVSMRVPLVRLHDPNWPHPREVDIHIVFPDFSKDPADPDSYNFSQTDEYLRTVAATGAKIVYRLGESIEHTEKKYFVHPPENYEKWAQICIGIIRHYNEGWADGFHYGIEYWEIWNEPDFSVKMWSGTHEQYYSLYETAATAIKRYDPSLKVGGPAVARPTADFVPEFLEHCREKQVPLDFFSWHTYTADPQVFADRALHVRSLLDQYGFKDTESHLNEWNYFVADFGTIWQKGNEYLRADTFNRQKGEEGASFSAYILALLQDLPVDAANYYDGQPTALFCGLFDYHGVPQKTYYTFQAFENLRRHNVRLHCELPEDAEGLSCLAAKDENGAIAALLTNFHNEDRGLTLRLNGLTDSASAYERIQIYSIDGERNLELIQEEQLSSAEWKLELKKYSVFYVRILP